MELLKKAVQTDSLEKIKEIVESKGIPTNSKWLDYALLNNAIEIGRVDVAKFLLEKKCRVNKTSKSSELLNTPLHNAVKLGDLDLIHSLLEKKASIKAVNFEGDTPLHIAFMTRQEKTVDAMLEYIENTAIYENVKNNQGLTHMHIACSRNNGKIVENFLEAGADLNDSINIDSTFWPGYKALHIAVHFESLEVVTVLKKASRHIDVEDSNGFNPLRLAYEKLKDLSAMVHILAENMNVESIEHRQLSYFHIACLRDDPVAVETFIKNGADVNLAVSRDAVFCPLYTPLHFAVESNCKRNVELLLAHGADPQLRDKSDMTPLHLAMYNEDHRQRGTIVDVLYNVVTDKEIERPDCNGLGLFHIAVTRNDIRMVKKFLAKDIDVNDPILWNLRRFSHYTSLHFSVLYGHINMTELLIKRGANVNRSDSGLDGTPLHLAVETGQKIMINLLLAKGARADEIRFHEHRTTLHLLVLFCVNNMEDDTVEWIEKLVELGCDVNAKDCDGNTALHLACSKLFNGGECARLLLEFGADINLENEEGKTAFNMSFYLNCEVDVEYYIMLYEHVQKLKALGIKINPKNEICCETLIKANQQIQIDESDRIQQQIQDEIAKLKSVKFNKRITLFDFLFFDPKRLINYVQNDVLENIVQSEDLDEQYPLYAYLIKLQYQKGLNHFGANEVEKRPAKFDNDGNTSSNKRRRF